MELSAAGVLEAEHRYIQKVVGVAALHADGIEAGETPDFGLLGEVLDFLRAYADECHHGKEEALFFPALERNGVPPGGCPLGALKHEHVAGRALVADLATAVTDRRAGAEVPVATVLTCLKGLIELYPNHIWKEDYLLFPMAGKVLTDQDELALADEFAKADEAFGLVKRRRFEEWADAVSDRALAA
ncbi:MAG TPA: hemerythrin domain-containing protein [Armatimonadota bacterium]